MIRIFLRVYLILLLPLLALLLLQWNPLSWFTSRWAEEQVQVQMIGTFRLIQQELEALPERQWGDAVTEMARHFPYRLTLHAIGDLDLSRQMRERLLRQDLILQPRPSPQALYRLHGSDKVLALALQSGDAEETAAQVQGVRYLVSRRLEQADDPTRVIAEIGRLYPFPLRLRPAKASDLPEAVRKTLHRLGAARQELDEDSMLLHVLSESGSYLITAGPIPMNAVRKRYPYLLIALPAALLAFGLLLWTSTLWWELRHLKAVANAFGEGHLEQRARLSRYSTLYSLSASYNRMAGQIQRLLGSQQDLINAVSHELKTPIARMRFSLEMLAESRTNQERERFGRQLESNLDELEALATELLEHARLRRDANDRARQRIGLASWLEDQAREFRAYHPGLKISLRLTADNHPDVCFEPRLMRRALFNLLDNAARHAVSHILIVLERHDGQHCIAVEDDGPGIPDGAVDLFEPFTRLDDSRQRGTGGHGLGLAIVKSIMQGHQGGVHHEASALGGARFVICWPGTAARSEAD